MVWRMFSAAGVGPLAQLHGRESEDFCQNLLRQCVALSLWASSSQSAILMEDDAPYHTAKCVKQFLEAKNIQIFNELASPDPNLNPKISGKSLATKSEVITKKPTTVTKLCERLEEEWTKIAPEQCLQLQMCWDHSKLGINSNMQKKKKKSLPHVFTCI